MGNLLTPNSSSPQFLHPLSVLLHSGKQKIYKQIKNDKQTSWTPQVFHGQELKLVKNTFFAFFLTEGYKLIPYSVQELLQISHEHNKNHTISVVNCIADKEKFMICDAIKSTIILVAMHKTLIKIKKKKRGKLQIHRP